MKTAISAIAFLLLAGCFIERPAKPCHWWYAPDGCYEPYQPPQNTSAGGSDFDPIYDAVVRRSLQLANAPEADKGIFGPDIESQATIDEAIDRLSGRLQGNIDSLSGYSLTISPITIRLHKP